MCCSEAQLRSFRQALVLGPVDDLRKPCRAVDNHKVTLSGRAQLAASVM